MKEKNSWKDILTDYRIYIGIIVVLLLIIIMLAVDLFKDKNPKNEEDSTEPVAEEVQEPDGEAEPEPEPPKNLEMNDHPSLDRLVEQYCEYIANGDVESLEGIVDVLTDEEKQKIQSRAAFIESYDNVTCYTVDGLEEDSYIIFICYDLKLINIQTAAPGVICLNVSPKDENGNRYIHYTNDDEAVNAYVAELEKNPDIQALYEDATARYQAALESDEMLAEFMQRISGQVEEEEPQPEETPEESQEPEGGEEAPAEETQEEAAATAQNRETHVAETVNVRSEASTESERLALAYQGDSITQIESYDNGWSKVEYQGMTGYVMTEYLE